MRREILTICSFVICIAIAVLCTCGIVGVWLPIYQDVLGKIMATAGIITAPFCIVFIIAFVAGME